MRSSFSRATTILLSVLMCVTAIPVRVLGDEGMFLPDALNRAMGEKLKKRGLKIPLTEIYNPNGVSLKDAVVIVDGGTGEFISPEGLLLTNHHVAFEALAAASDLTKDYATKGYKAASRAEELPAKDYTVTMTQDLKDITGEILKGFDEKTSPEERAGVIQQRVRQIESAGRKEADGISVQVLPMNEGLAYYQFTYLVLRDVRIVYAPPKNIGFFGGDDDNFEWPRHDGDFTFMRAYVGANGKPADYAATNVPFKPKKFLPISLSGVREGDFMMVLGYPGSTRRYRESYSVAYNQDVLLPFQIEFLSNRIDLLREAGREDPALHIKLESTIFDLSNTMKNFAGSVTAMKQAAIVEKKRAEEAAFGRWIEGNASRQTKYGAALPALQQAYDELLKTGQRDAIVQQLFDASDVFEIALAAPIIAADKDKPAAERNTALGSAVQRLRSRLDTIFQTRYPSVERGTFLFLLGKAAELPPGQKIDFLEKRFGQLTGTARRRAEAEYANALVDSKRFATAEAANALLDMSSSQLENLHEPLVELAAAVNRLSQEARPRTQRFNATVVRWRPVILEGMSEMKGSMSYPDANRTLRFTYGDVKGYVPHDAATYSAFSHLSGVIEKDTGREPFNVPEKLKQLYRSHDFGSYAEGADVPVDFLSDTDIIGGNSGSPIMNGRGEQVGIIFDGNYEGLGNDFFYNENKGRAIAVDIRYVLFVTEKFGGAGYLLKELDVRGQSRSAGSGAGKN